MSLILSDSTYANLLSKFVQALEIGQKINNAEIFSSKDRKKNRHVMKNLFKQITNLNSESPSNTIEGTFRNLTAWKDKSDSKDVIKLVFLSLDWYVKNEHIQRVSKTNRRSRYVELAQLFKNTVAPPISTLPDELLLHVFSFVDSSDKTISKVCQKWESCLQLMQDRTKIDNIFLNNTVSNDHVRESSIEIGKLWTDDKTRAEDLLQYLLKKLSTLGIDQRCHIARIIAQTWNDMDNFPSGSLQGLVNFMHSHFLCDPAFKLAFQRNQRSLTNSTDYNYGNSPNPVPAIKLTPKNKFPAIRVSQEVLSDLSISSKNSFEVNELVAVVAKGSMIGNTQSLFYACVAKVIESPNSSPVYACSMQYSRALGSWVDELYLSPDTIGKLSNSGKIRMALPNNLLSLSTPQSA